MEMLNKLSSRFNTVEGRREIIRLYADSNTMFVGENSDGETVYLSVSKTGMVLKTDQENGWVRVSRYDADGYLTEESFEARWKWK